MKLKAVAARQGIHWVRAGFAVFFRRPVAFTALFAGFLFFALVLMLIHFVGGVLLLVSLPLVTLGFMLATQRALLAQTPTPAVFIAPLRGEPRRRKTLIRLGIVYALATLAIIALSDWIDGGKFEALQTAVADGKVGRDTIEQLLHDPQLHFGLLVRFGLAGALSVPFWFAPALVHWDGQGVRQSLFSSTLAMWRARGAFAVYLLAWTFVILVFAVLVQVMFSLLGAPQMAGIAAAPGALMFSTAFYASLYFGFADCFEL
jgi:hypothetical protein